MLRRRARLDSLQALCSGSGLALLLLAPLAAPAAPAPLDLERQILAQCGAPGYRPESGCRVALPAGTFAISDTVRIGGCTAATVRNSVILEGQSTGMLTTEPRFPTAGTTLQWTGPRRGVMFDVCGASFLSFRDLAIDAAGTSVAFRISADNKAAAISHFVELKNLVIDGAQIGVYVTGRSFNDQVDFVTLERVSLYDVGIGYLQDSQQSVAGRMETVEVAAVSKGFEIRNGSLTCDGCYVGSLPAGLSGTMQFIAFHLAGGTDSSKPWLAHQQVHIEHSHMELDRGRFVVEDAGSAYPITLIGNSYSLQCAAPDCEMLLVDSRGTGSLVMIGDVVQAASNPPARPRARVCHRGSELVRLGVVKKPEVADLLWTCER